MPELTTLPRRSWLAVAGLATGVPVVALVVGFFWFVASLETSQTNRVPHAEGIVALTGGADRIADAVDLIATGHADRMLISGVNPSISGEEIARLMPEQRNWFDCCIELGYDALNTLGNAAETREWAKKHNIRHSLIVVTSNYHMPRALLELGRALPEVVLVPFPVVSDKGRGGVFADLQLTRTLGLEYLKYIAALARIRTVPPPMPATDAAALPMPPGLAHRASVQR